jgi:3-oxoacyl-[acyl-carrier protein] reductase
VSTALLFPGQGSQRVGMGTRLAAEHRAARDALAEADEALGRGLARLCFEGPEAELTRTENAQPAILAVSVATWRALAAEVELRPRWLAGHSLGEYTALVVAGALAFGDALRLVRLRGRLMQAAAPEGTGAMAAIIGLDDGRVAELCAAVAGGEVVAPANLNGGGQVVVAGHRPAVGRAMAAARAAGARVVELPVSAPFHCPLMAPAAEGLARRGRDRPARAPGGEQRRRATERRPRAGARPARRAGDGAGALGGVDAAARGARVPARARDRSGAGAHRAAATHASRHRRARRRRGRRVAGAPGGGVSGPLAGQVALVTGAARGIGAAIARDLAAAGAHVAVNYRPQGTPGEAVVAEIVAAGGSAEALPFDVTDPVAVEEAVRALVERLGKLDVLVNNAGVSADALILRTSDDHWHRLLDVNLKGVFNCTKAAARRMMRVRAGRIINVGSVVGVMGNTGQAAYAAAKAGVIGFTKSTARELAGRGITANVVAPGLIETDMTEGLDSAARDVYLALIPLGRLGKSEEVAAAVTFLAGPGAAYITGQVIHVNGGLYV